MTSVEITKVLQAHFRKRIPPEAPPSAGAWQELESRFSCTLPEDFRTFHEVVSGFWFEGELLAIEMGGVIDAPDTIVAAVEAEKELGGWPSEMIPFFAIGDGDYLCLSAREGGESCVYIVDHSNREVETIHASFGEWVDRLSEYF